jgi:hypothetical protein
MSARPHLPGSFISLSVSLLLSIHIYIYTYSYVFLSIPDSRACRRDTGSARQDDERGDARRVSPRPLLLIMRYSRDVPQRSTTPTRAATRGARGEGKGKEQGVASIPGGGCCSSRGRPAQPGRAPAAGAWRSCPGRRRGRCWGWRPPIQTHTHIRTLDTIHTCCSQFFTHKYTCGTSR